MKRLEPLTLNGRHVRLAPLALSHVPALLAASRERATYAFTLVPRTLDEMTAYVAKALADQERGESLPFVVHDAAGTVVGSTRYMEIDTWTWAQEPPPPVPAGPDALEIGFTWYAERVQRTGLNTEAKLLLCTHAFDDLRVRRVTWRTDERNARSRAAILRLGATFEGILRAHRPGVDNTVRNTASYAMIASEWPAARAALQAKLERD